MAAFCLHSVTNSYTHTKKTYKGSSSSMGGAGVGRSSLKGESEKKIKKKRIDLVTLI